MVLALSMPGTTELLIIAIVVLVVFGAGRLPEIGKNLGSGIRLFRRGLTNLDDDDFAEAPRLKKGKKKKKKKRDKGLKGEHEASLDGSADEEQPGVEGRASGRPPRDQGVPEKD